MNAIQEVQLLTVRQMVDVLGGVNEATVRKLCREGVIPSVRIGRRIYVPVDEFNNYVKEVMKHG